MFKNLGKLENETNTSWWIYSNLEILEAVIDGKYESTRQNSIPCDT